ncbi:hypothetical protein VTK73DRAFT_7520 [Phialemonium thermophilum]|uniref:Uncharacterized protein n=1 Tax=Phialemonium thermophilum TaxID=223376 RepID=A0ABR3WDX7_9PEZI
MAPTRSPNTSLPRLPLSRPTEVSVCTARRAGRAKTVLLRWNSVCFYRQLSHGLHKPHITILSRRAIFHLRMSQPSFLSEFPAPSLVFLVILTHVHSGILARGAPICRGTRASSESCFPVRAVGVPPNQASAQRNRMKDQTEWAARVVS